MAFLRKLSDIDLGTMEIENIFINDFMPQANGTFVKVYLFGYKLSYEDDIELRRYNNNTIATNLGIPVSDVTSAYRYWAEKKIVNIVNIRSEHDFDVEYMSIRALYISQNYVNASKVKDMVKDSFENKQMSELFERINGTLSVKLLPREWETMLSFIEEYKVEHELVVAAFQSLGKVNVTSRVKYVKTTIVNWMESGVKNLEDLEQIKAVNTERFRMYKDILRALGYPYQYPSIGEKEIIDKWLDQDKMSLEYIMNTISDITKKKRSPSMNYINSALLGNLKQDGQKKTSPKVAKDSPYTDEEIKNKMMRKAKNG